MTTNSVSVKIEESLLIKLKELRLYKRETYSDTIERLIDYFVKSR